MGKHVIRTIILAMVLLTLGGFNLAAQGKSTPVKLTMYIIGNWPQAGQDEVFAKFNTELLKRASIQVEFRALGWGDYGPKMQVVNAAGEEYDIAFASNWTGYIQNVSKGAFLPLDDLLKKYAPKTFASIAPKYWDATRVNGKIYAVLNQQIFARTSYIAGRKEYADLAGIKMPQYPDYVKDIGQLEPFLKALKAKLPPDVTPFAFAWESLREYYNYDVVAPGVVVNIKNGKTTAESEYGTKEFKSFYDLAVKWNKDGYLHGGEWVSVQDLMPAMRAGKIAFFNVGTYKPGVEIETMPTVGDRPVYGFSLSAPIATTGGIVSTMFGIGRNSKYPAEAMQFLELLNTDKELYALINIGIEGVHYTKVDANTIEKIPNSSYDPNVAWELGTNFLAYVQKGQPATVWADTKALNNSAIASPLVGFNFDVEPVKTEVAQIAAIWEQYKRLVANGVGSAKEYNEILDKVKKAGVDRVVAEANKQIKAWQATNK